MIMLNKRTYVCVVALGTGGTLVDERLLGIILVRFVPLVIDHNPSYKS